MTARLYMLTDIPSFSPALQGSWDSGASAYRVPGSIAKSPRTTNTASSGNGPDQSPGALAAGYKGCYSSYASPALAAGTLSGTMRLVQTMNSSNGTSVPRVYAWVSVGASSTVRAVLADWTGSAAVGFYAPYDTGDISISTTAVSAGDRIVIELGYVPTAATQGSFFWSANANGSDGPYAIAGMAGNSTAAYNSSASVTFSDPGGVITSTWEEPPLRFFLTNSSADYAPTTLQGSWDMTSSYVTQALSSTASGTAATVAVAETSATATKILLGRFVSPPASVGGSTAGALIRGQFSLRESSTAADMFPKFYIYATVGDSDTVRGVLYNNTTTVELTNAQQGRPLPAYTLSTVTLQAGDRIVVEVGVNATNVVTTSYTATLQYGGTGTPLYDGLGTGVGWIDLLGLASLFAGPYTYSVSGSSAGVGASTGDAVLVPGAGGTTYSTSGSSDATGASTGAVTVSRDAAGAAVGTGGSSGSVQLGVTVSSISAGIEASVGTLVLARTMSGSSTGTSTSSGAILLGIAESGSTAGSAASTGSAQFVGSTAGSTAGTSTSSGSASLAYSLSGTCSATQTSTGAQAIAGTVAGTTAGLGTSTGALTTSGAGAASTTAMVGASSGALSVSVTVSGSTAGTSTSSGAEVRSLTVAGATTGLQASSGSQTRAVTASGTSAATGAGTGTVASGSDMLGSTTGVQASAGSITSTRVLAGSAAATSTSTGALTTSVTLGGSTAGSASSTGSAAAARTVAGSSAAATTSSGSVGLTLLATGSSASTGSSTGMVSSGSDQLGATAGAGASTGTLGVERNLTGTTAMVGGTTSTMNRVVSLIGAAVGLGGGAATISMVYDATGITAAYQSATGTSTLRSPLLATSDLVVTTWLKTITGIDAGKVATTLPENTQDWGEVGFIQARTVGGSPDIYLPVGRPVVQVDVWAVKPGTGRPLWNVANVLAMRIVEASRDELNLRRELVLPQGYPRAHVLECYPLTEPYRVESDPGSYARFRFDMQFHWVAVS